MIKNNSCVRGCASKHNRPKFGILARLFPTVIHIIVAPIGLGAILDLYVVIKVLI